MVYRHFMRSLLRAMPGYLICPLISPVWFADVCTLIYGFPLNSNVFNDSIVTPEGRFAALIVPNAKTPLTAPVGALGKNNVTSTGPATPTARLWMCAIVIPVIDDALSRKSMLVGKTTI